MIILSSVIYDFSINPISPLALAIPFFLLFTSKLNLIGRVSRVEDLADPQTLLEVSVENSFLFIINIYPQSNLIFSKEFSCDTKC